MRDGQAGLWRGARWAGVLSWAGVLIALYANAGHAEVSNRDDDAFLILREDQTVTAASKRPQPMSESPSMVSVLTAQEIRAHGYRTLGEALQWVRGIYTRYDRNYTYLGVRGLQRPADYNNKVLLTLNGHTMNSPIYGDAAFGRELGLDLEQVERIEVVRGPGSVLYGSNAFLAVVNVVTREGRSAPAAETVVGAGSLGERRVFTGLAGSRPGLPEFSISGSWTDVRGAEWDPLGSAPGLGVAEPVSGLDRERGLNLLASLRWGDTRLAVKVNNRLKNIPTGAYGTRIGDPGTHTQDGHDFVELASLAQPGNSVELSGRAYWDGSRYRGEYAYGPDSARYLNHDLGTSDVVGAEARLNWRLWPGHVATGGVEGRWILRALQSNADADPFYLYTRSNVRGSTGSVYLQNEARTLGNARVTAGARLDSDSDRPPVLSPRLDVLVPLGANTHWKLLAGSAFRSPVPYETHYEFEGQLPKPDLLPERVTTLETSVERRFGAARVGVSAYRSWIRDLIDVVVLDSTGLWSYYNRSRVASTGLETEAAWSPRPGLHLRADLAWQRSRDAELPVNLSDSPYWNGHFVVTQALRANPVRLGIAMRWLGARETLSGRCLPSYALVNTRVAWLPRSAFELGLEVRNVLDIEYTDPAGAEHLEDAIPQDGRTFYATVSLWRSPPR